MYNTTITKYCLKTVKLVASLRGRKRHCLKLIGLSSTTEMASGTRVLGWTEEAT